jgi:NAD(P)H dehydrogenase (quinone)
VAELTPRTAIDANPAWRAHADATAHIEVAALEDLEWADAYAFGTPTRFGNVSSQLKQFLNTAGALTSLRHGHGQGTPTPATADAGR